MFIGPVQKIADSFALSKDTGGKDPPPHCTPNLSHEDSWMVLAFKLLNPFRL